MTFNLAYSAAGALTGFIVGLTGVGGGALMTPILLLVFGIAPRVAVGTDLWFAALTKLAVVRSQHTKGLIDWPIAKFLWLGSLPAASMTIGAMALWPEIIGAGSLLKPAIAIAIFITAASIIFRSLIQSVISRLTKSTRGDTEELRRGYTILAGAILGTLVTLTSVGAGALGTVFLTGLYPTRLDPKRLIATDIVHAIPLALVAGGGHLFAGFFDIELLLNLLIGSIPAILIGSWLSFKLPNQALRVAIAVVLSAVAYRLL